MRPAENVICVDIDGVIASKAPSYEEAVPLPGAIAALHKLRSLGYRIWLYTGRHLDQHDVTMKWLGNNDVPYDDVLFGKPPAVAYIDDLAIRFTGNWDEIVEQFDAR